MKNSLSLTSFFICCISLYACLDNEDEFNMALIQNKLKTETDNYYKLRMFNCREDVLRDAEMFVDSIMINEMSFNLGGNLYFPNRPNKPGYIGRIELNDSTRPKPFLDITLKDIPQKTQKDSTNN